MRVSHLSVRSSEIESSDDPSMITVSSDEGSSASHEDSSSASLSSSSSSLERGWSEEELSNVELSYTSDLGGGMGLSSASNSRRSGDSSDSSSSSSSVRMDSRSAASLPSSVSEEEEENPFPPEPPAPPLNRKGRSRKDSRTIVLAPTPSSTRPTNRNRAAPAATPLRRSARAAAQTPKVNLSVHSLLVHFFLFPLPPIPSSLALLLMRIPSLHFTSRRNLLEESFLLDFHPISCFLVNGINSIREILHSCSH